MAPNRGKHSPELALRSKLKREQLHLGTVLFHLIGVCPGLKTENYGEEIESD